MSQTGTIFDLYKPLGADAPQVSPAATPAGAGGPGQTEAGGSQLVGTARTNSSPALPAGPSSPALPAGKTGTIFDLYKPLGAPPDAPPEKPAGGFGPFDPGTEGKMFLGPADKGVMEGFARSYGLKSPNEGVGDVLRDTWNNLIEGGKQTWEKLRTTNGALASGALFVPQMVASGIDGTANLLEQGSSTLREGLRSGDHQVIGQGIGTLIGALSQVAMGMEGGGAAEGAVKKLGAKMEEMAPGPGNALVRANSERNYRFGKNPGRYLVDEPVHPTNSLNNLLDQNEAHQAQLHAQVQQTLRNADWVTVPDKTPGTFKSIPNVIDPVAEIDEAADEVLNDLKGQKGLTNRPAIIQAVKDTREDMLVNHDPNGKPTGMMSRTQLPSQVNELKKSLGGRADYTVYSDADQATKAKYVDRFVKRSYGKLNDLVDDAVGGMPGERIRDLNRRYSNAIEFQDLLKRRVALEAGTGGFQSLLRKGEWGSAMLSLLSGNPAMQAGGAALLVNRALRSTAGRIMTAKALDAAGGALQSGAVGTAARVALAGGVAAAPDLARKGAASDDVGQGARKLLGGQ